MFLILDKVLVSAFEELGNISCIIVVLRTFDLPAETVPHTKILKFG